VHYRPSAKERSAANFGPHVTGQSLEATLSPSSKLQRCSETRCPQRVKPEAFLGEQIAAQLNTLRNKPCFLNGRASQSVSVPGKETLPLKSLLGVRLSVLLLGIALSALAGCGYSGSATPMKVPAGVHDSVHLHDTDGIGSAAPPVHSNPVKSDRAGDFNGGATFSNLIVATAGNTYQLSATGVGPASATSASFTVSSPSSTTAKATRLVFVQQPSDALTQSVISPAITVAVEDAAGNVVQSATNPIVLSLSGGTTALGGAAMATPLKGIATFSNLTIATAGTEIKLSATSPGLTSATSAPVAIGTPSIAVTVGPLNASIVIGATKQFTSAVAGIPNSAIAWNVSGYNCDGRGCGTISSDGLYTAPAGVPPSAHVTVTATSVVDPRRSASATITITPPQAPGYSLAWQDTFSTLSLCSTNGPGCNWFDPGIWNYPAGGVITDPSGTFVNLNWLTTQGSNYTNMTTASMNGAYFRSWTFGYIEISMAFNPVTGNWPALWMLPVEWNQSEGANHSDGLPYGELDLFEWFSDHPTVGYGAVHVWENNTDIANNYGTNKWPLPAGTILSNFNTYGVLWTPTAISWYFNNQLVENFSTTGAHFHAVFAGQQSYTLLLSEQSGCDGEYGVCSDHTLSSPLNMQVRWVHIYAPPSP
jgi:Glycosyl hydrolases family 16